MPAYKKLLIVLLILIILFLILFAFSENKKKTDGIPLPPAPPITQEFIGMLPPDVEECLREKTAAGKGDFSEELLSNPALQGYINRCFEEKLTKEFPNGPEVN